MTASVLQSGLIKIKSSRIVKTTYRYVISKRIRCPYIINDCMSFVVYFDIKQINFKKALLVNVVREIKVDQIICKIPYLGAPGCFKTSVYISHITICVA